jgi:general secretion pathway protein F
MPSFRYTAFDSLGARRTGVIAADSREDALSRLMQDACFVTSIDADNAASTTQPWWRREIGGGVSLPLHQLAMMTRELATLSAAHLPVDEVLLLASKQSRVSGRVQHLLVDAHQRVLEGASMSEALANSHGSVPEFVWRLIRAGEAVGRLPLVLDRLADYLQASDRKRGQLISALLYPAFLILTAFAALMVVMSVMVPAIHPLFTERGVAAPFIIEAMARVHRVVTGQALWLAVAGAAAILGAGSFLLWPGFALARARAKLGLPFVGRLTSARETAQFSRVLGLLVGNGVPLIQALMSVDGVLTNKEWMEAIAAARDRLNEGGSLSDRLAETKLLPELALRLISAGERTGQLAEQLSRVADIYELEVERSMDRGLTLVGPLLTVAIGIVIGGLMLSILQAVLSVNDLGLR